ncbi:MAG: amidohydrolase [Pirellulaceae bacterium]
MTDSDLFGEKSKVLETWVLGQRHEHTRDPLFDVRGQWNLKLAPKPSQGGDIELKIAGELSKLEGTSRPLAAKSNGKSKKPANDEAGDKLKQVGLRDARFSALVEAKPWGHSGIAQLSLVLLDDENSDLQGLGVITWPDGSQSRIEATRHTNADEKSEAATSDDKDSADKQSNDKDADSPAEASSKPTPVVYPLGAFGAAGSASATECVAFTNATIWTCGPEGILENATLLSRDGRIEAVGADVKIPADARVMNVEGKHITPGIIDCHSHMATDGGINESTQAVTAEVRIGDFVDSDDINIYRQLAGGVTSANILHGSANPIGGQNQVIKLRWGALPEAMKFAEAPAGIKFALGENVKQSNWGERFTSRYPQTRMGVEQIIYDSFQTAHEYEQQWDRWRKSHRGSPPRRDLELDALVEILRGERWIHCHSYRQDEILALLRTLEEFHITIGSLQHILEGYKVADAMAQHGAMGSSFSDWWAYKFEVYDAIPYNGVLMHNAGVVVSFNSDDAELARHLNHEAAKAVKYGGVPAEEALKFVTLNPAKQLRIDTLVGSLEPGKHADFVIWSGPPLSTLSRCEQTWIDGRNYFDLTQDQQLRQRDRELKNRLIQKALRGDGPMLNPGESNSTEEVLWPRVDIFCRASNHRQGR